MPFGLIFTNDLGPPSLNKFPRDWPAGVVRQLGHARVMVDDAARRDPICVKTHPRREVGAMPSFVNLFGVPECEGA